MPNTAWILLLALGLSIILLGCRSRKPPAAGANLSPLVDELEQAGFFEHVPPEQIASCKEEILQTGYLYPESVGRYINADAEDLAEGMVLNFLAQAGPLLLARGVRLPIRVREETSKIRDLKTGKVNDVTFSIPMIDVSLPDEPGHPSVRPVSENFSESGDTVTVGKFTQEIWNKRMTDVQCWEAGMHHTFLLLNRLLEKAGSKERVYGLYGGNDGGAVFLTPRQADIIRASKLIPSADKPWVPHAIQAK